MPILMQALCHIDMNVKLFSTLLFSLITYSTSSLAATHHPQEFLKSISGKPDEGSLIVKHFCSNCHALKPLISLGAPRVGIEAEWKPRLKDGINGLLKNTSEGIGNMPPRGGCFECTDKQLILAIKAMLPKEQFSHKKDRK